MPTSTTDLYIKPEDRWVLVSTDPAFLFVKPDAFHPWWFAVTSGGAPAAGVLGIQMGRGNDHRREPLELKEVTGEVYIRIADPVASTPTGQMRFGVVQTTA